MFPEIPPEIPLTWRDLLTRTRVRFMFLWRKVLPPPDLERRAQVQLALRDSSEPDFDYFVLVLLSCTIATFGLLIDSSATIIGAMLVAPLMSPILGLGLASIRGDTTLLRNAFSALLRGAILAVLLSAFITWTNTKLPFISLDELPLEVLARTRPSPIDLGVALAGGLAATFALVQPNLSAALPGVAIATALMPPLCVIGVGIALGDWEVASGATLLFVTNAVTIAASAIGLFFAMGFGVQRKPGDSYLPRSLILAGLLTVLLLAPLGVQSYQFVQQAHRASLINEVVRSEMDNIPGAELVSVESNQVGDTLEIAITIRALEALSYQDAVALREKIDVQLQQPVQLTITQISAGILDPRVPPTLTPTPQATSTPSPTPSASPTPSPTPTSSPTATLTAIPTDTPTPGTAIVDRSFGKAISLRQEPNGAIIAYLQPNAIISVLYEQKIVDGWVWIQVMDAQGRVGWIPEIYVSTPIPTE